MIVPHTMYMYPPQWELFSTKMGLSGPSSSPVGPQVGPQSICRHALGNQQQTGHTPRKQSKSGSGVALAASLST